MTNQNDALIAEAVGYSVYHGADSKGETMYILVSPQEMQRGGIMRWIVKYNFNLWKMTWWPDEAIEQFGEDLPPFDSAPTADTDQIVLEWVQGQDDNLFTADKFYSILGKLLAVADGRLEGIVYTGLGAMNGYKPGMYAQSLLAIQEDRGD